MLMEKAKALPFPAMFVTGELVMATEPTMFWTSMPEEEPGALFAFRIAEEEMMRPPGYTLDTARALPEAAPLVPQPFVALNMGHADIAALPLTSAISIALPSTATADEDDAFTNEEDVTRTGPQLLPIDMPTPAPPPIQFATEELTRVTPAPTPMMERHAGGRPPPPAAERLGL